jgi:hypothetical protein
MVHRSHQKPWDLGPVHLYETEAPERLAQLQAEIDLVTRAMERAPMRTP